MDAEIHERLRSRFRSGTAILLCGSGIAAALDPAAPTWVKLLRSGMKYIDAEKTKGAIELLTSEQPSLKDLLDAATLLRSHLDEERMQAWLNEQFSGLNPTNEVLQEALSAHKCVIVTTNYDDLIEKSTGRTGVSWDEPDRIFQLVREEPENVVLHIHGSWGRPESVVMAPSDYERQKGQAQIQTIQQALCTLNSLVCIGVGMTVEDPNIGNMLDEFQSTFGVSGDHFLLHRGIASELDLPESLSTVSFGDNYGELAKYLKGLAPVSGATDQLTSPARAALSLIQQDLHDSCMLAPDTAGMTSVAQFVPAPALADTPPRVSDITSLFNAPTPKRINTDDVVSSPAAWVIAADRGYGLTSALQWLVASKAERAPGIMPITIDFVDLCKPDGLHKSVQRQVRKTGMNRALEDELPRLALAIDGWQQGHGKVSAVLSQLDEYAESIDALYIGTATENLQETVAAAGKLRETKYAYVAPVSPSVAEEMCKIAGIDPEAGRWAAEQAERLGVRRTPFNVSLFIKLYERRSEMVGDISETGVLHAYLSNLLTQGGFQQSNHSDLTTVEAERTLAAVAGRMASTRSEDISDVDLLNVISELWSSVGWDYNRGQFVQAMQNAGVLQKNGNVHSFSHHAYLNLFGGIAVENFPEFRQEVVENPMELRHIATMAAGISLNARDFLDSTIKALDQLSLDNELKLGGVAPSGAAPMDVDAYQVDIETDESVSTFSFQSFELVDTTEAFSRVSNDENARRAALVMSGSLILKRSTMLNLDAQVAALHILLEHWAQLASDLVATGDSLSEIEKMIESLATSEGELSAEVLRELTDLLPVLFVFIVASLSLNSLKLAKAFDEVLKSDSLSDGGFIAGVFVMTDNQMGDWTETLIQAFQRLGKTSLVRYFLFQRAHDLHNNERLKDEESELSLRRALIHQYLAPGQNTIPMSKSNQASQLDTKLKSLRLTALQRRSGSS